MLEQTFVDVLCFSHTLDHVGENILAPEAEMVMSTLIQMFSHSHVSRLIWKEVTGKRPKTYSSTRWWSKFEFTVTVADNWSVMEPFAVAMLERRFYTNQVQ